MRPPTGRIETQGWAMLAGATVVAAIALWLAWDGGELAERYRAAKAGITDDGSSPLALQIERQRAANTTLEATLHSLKEQVGISLEKGFQVSTEPEYKRQPGYFFVITRDSIIGRLRKRAQEKGIQEYDEYAGFGTGPNQPPSPTPPVDALADDLLKTLQLTDRVVGHALETPTPLQRLMVRTHPSAIKPVEVAPPGRPPLFREYSLTLEARGSLKDILWLLHRLSPGRAEAAKGEYPLILRSLSLTSDNISPIQSITQIDMVLTVAGMEFLPDDRRRATAGGPSAGGPVATPTPSARSF